MNELLPTFHSYSRPSKACGSNFGAARSTHTRLCSPLRLFSALLTSHCFCHVFLFSRHLELILCTLCFCIGVECTFDWFSNFLESAPQINGARTVLLWDGVVFVMKYWRQDDWMMGTPSEKTAATEMFTYEFSYMNIWVYFFFDLLANEPYTYVHICICIYLQNECIYIYIYIRK